MLEHYTGLSVAAVPPKIAVVVASFNRAEMIPSTINSILSQHLSSGSFDLVVVDDGSTDDTVAKISQIYNMQTLKTNSHMFHKDNFYLVAAQNQERGAARNTGAHFASKVLGSKWLFFMDSDDLLLPDSLSKFVSRLNQLEGKNVGVVGAIYANREEWNDLTGEKKVILRDEEPETRVIDDVLDRTLLAVGSTLISSQVFFDLGGFSEDRKLSGSEDWHLWVRLALKTNIYYSPHVSYSHRQHPGSTNANGFSRSIPFACKMLETLVGEEFGQATVNHYKACANLRIAGAFNSERQLRKSFSFWINAVKLDYRVVFAPSSWRLLSSIVWRRLGRAVGRKQ